MVMETTKCVCPEPLVLTPAAWKAKHRDFKSTRVVNGKRVRTALRLCPEHGTTSVPVTLSKGESK